MLLFLCQLPVWEASLLLVVAPTLIAMAGPVVVRRRVDLLRLTTNNEIAGFKFATVGVIYAVILAFAIVAVWERYSEAETATTKEAGAAATLYRLAQGPEPAAVAARQALTAYLDSAIRDDWPAMAAETESRKTTAALNSLYDAILALPEILPRKAAAAPAMIGELDIITQARRTRLHLSEGIIPSMLWGILVCGALMTVAFTFFFGTENLSAQVAMTGILSSIVFMGLLVLVSFDHPFTGPVHASAQPLQAVIDDFGSDLLKHSRE
ncbi:DUF4239 domain-containing protein [Methylocystis heyeri]|nr:DUF4239 domain-containing protein [Methylocystis heyeri]